MRFISTLLFLLCPFVLLSANEISISDAHYRQMETGQFQHLTEFFTGEEVAGNRIILRSQQEQRDGLYFIITLSAPASSLPEGATVLLEWIRSDRKEMDSRSFSFEEYKNTRYLYLGLTGSDWPSTRLRPVAWKVSILDADGHSLAEWKSFLWEMP